MFDAVLRVAALTCTVIAATAWADTPEHVPFDVNEQRALAADKGTGDDWILHGRTFSEQRYSPLDAINTTTVATLGLAWQLDLGTDRGLEATPLMVDGTIFVSGTWSVVYAIDARTGLLKWRYDPKVPGPSARDSCCDVVNRGVAVWQGRVYSATFDGRLIALEAKTGKLIWEVDTVDHHFPYTITGAPRIVKGNVLIGNGGAEFGVRGYVSAYRLSDGKLTWRFYTVPRNADGPFESPELAKAARTWDRSTKDWYDRGGGTVWDSMAYDPALDLLYVGTGNAPWTPAVPNPGEGDKLYTACIVALNPDSGKLVWYYQETPGDRWDFTSTQHIILVDLNIGGKLRQVLMQAPKNGFFYILDRRTGELLSAEKYGVVTWASKVDLGSGRPVLTPHARYWGGKPETMMYPWVAGDHNWQPMSFSPRTGLVYIPAQQSWWIHSDHRVTHYDEQTPNFKALQGEQPLLPTRGFLRAWDPVHSRVVWQAELPTLGNGGTLVTGGDVVFQGAADGNFSAYDARDGRLLKRIPIGTGIIAAPITYRLDGIQYVAIMAGFGGATFFMLDEQNPARHRLNNGRLLVFKLNGAAVPLPAEKTSAPVEPHAFEVEATPAQIERGIGLYRANCGRCHGMLTSKALLPDLRQLSDAKQSIFESIVLGGVLAPRGMASFADILQPQDVRDIQAALLFLRDHPDYGPRTQDAATLGLRPAY